MIVQQHMREGNLSKSIYMCSLKNGLWLMKDEEPTQKKRKKRWWKGWSRKTVIIIIKLSLEIIGTYKVIMAAWVWMTVFLCLFLGPISYQSNLLILLSSVRIYKSIRCMLQLQGLHWDKGSIYVCSSPLPPCKYLYNLICIFNCVLFCCR